MTEFHAVDPSQASQGAGRFRDKLNDLATTTIVYLAVAAASGVSYAICAAAWNGSTVVRFWLASVVPVALYLLFKTAKAAVFRKTSGDQQLELFRS